MLNGSISSYHTLKELTLESLALTEDVIDQIRKFENLEKLQFRDLHRHPDQLVHSDPICLPNLRSISYELKEHGFREFQRFLIGSNRQTVFNVETSHFYVESGAVPDVGFIPISKRPAIKQLNVTVEYYRGSWSFFDVMSKWLQSARVPNFKPFERINVNFNINTEYVRLNMRLPPLISLCQYSNKSKLEIQCWPMLRGPMLRPGIPIYSMLHHDMDEAVNKMLNAPFGTFTEIKMEMTFYLLSLCKRDDSKLYVKYLLNQLNGEENDEKHQDIVKKVVNQSIDDAEKWIKPCLLFNGERMKQIGLEKVDITSVCDLELRRPNDEDGYDM